ncbi:formin-like protein 20 [Eucalyptus grandis]|uniref:formin-like protein 20 n=1 Tax=Eucalyptus grandis TaxID=71139 RepID=UPI00192ED248|nr:formin-like protein 20 [Eucalyptus grandis]XP_039158771.1 formin-like protein 20 [Eucalyptus grandis]XP_039158772.1 formin-like protein 20 [Eucalyptus grandis]XP_039158773.1 formin-like protein 20 [Eucalyptus grandis]
MAKLCLHALLALLLLRLALSADPPQIPPSPSPELADGAPPPASGAPLSSPPSVGSPAASDTSSPPSPPRRARPPPHSCPHRRTADDAGPVPGEVHRPSPLRRAGGPPRRRCEQHEDGRVRGGGDRVGGGSAAGSGGVVYKNRKDNIRRAQYSHAARKEIL